MGRLLYSRPIIYFSNKKVSDYFFVFFAFDFEAVFLEDEQGVPFGLQDMYVTPPLTESDSNYHRNISLSNE
ncbi:MAG: hypothetical protein A2Y97_05735 [Nitrospirae bacterium RBG_13_39_12]|nr:MAG: hypothetical protein A2Y97_05735 [Nitrospirae bacterium RBG_13_39_12]